MLGMMKKLFLFLIGLLSMTVFIVSCSQEPAGTLSIDVSTQTEQWFSAKSGTKITLSSMDPTVMYAVKTKSGDARAVYPRGSEDDSSSILTTQVGTHIPIPEMDLTCTFLGIDVNITRSDDLSIIKLKLGQDFTLDTSERGADFIASDGTRVWEEYYYCDLLFRGYTQEELSHMVLVTEQSGSGSGSSDSAMVSLGFKQLANPETGAYGTVDLRGMLGVILYNNVGILSGTASTQKLILEPSTLIECDQTVQIKGTHEVLQVKAETADPEKEYVLEVTTYDPNAEYIRLNMRNSLTMSIFADNGESRGFIVPLGQKQDGTHLVYLGKIKPTRDFLIDFPLMNASQGLEKYADVRIREITPEEKNAAILTLTSEQKQTFTMDIDPAGNGFMIIKPVLVESENSNVLKNNLLITAECNYLNPDDSLGDYYEGCVETAVNTSHSYSVGYGNTSLMGSYAEGISPDSSYLEVIKLEVENPDPGKRLRITISIERSPEKLKWDFDYSKWKLMIVPNNGTKPYTMDVPTLEPAGQAVFTVPPAPSRPGYSFISWSLNGNPCYPGESCYMRFNDCLVAVWEKD